MINANAGEWIRVTNLVILPIAGKSLYRNTIGKIFKVSDITYDGVIIGSPEKKDEEVLYFLHGEYEIVPKPKKVKAGDTVKINKGWLKGAKGTVIHVGKGKKSRVQVALVKPRKGCELAVLSVKCVDVTEV